jgi:hypothetical protein
MKRALLFLILVLTLTAGATAQSFASPTGSDASWIYGVRAAIQKWAVYGWDASDMKNGFRRLPVPAR